ncbi:hypothetical protein FOA52_007246 [Chlamydomonas sp. UWO 241]|nr:hypothetical protein FOA52_007246 [Chlamydomonas sp. UWO 241]
MASAAAVSFWEQAVRQLLEAADVGDTAALERLLMIGAKELLMDATDSKGTSALMHAAKIGRVQAMRVLLGHPSADAGVMMMHTTFDGAMMMHATPGGDTALTSAAFCGHLDAMRMLLDHPSADAAAMMLHATTEGATALILAALFGHVDAVRLVLDQPTAPAAMMAVQSSGGTSALTAAARFAAGEPVPDDSDPPRSCAPLLLLLRREAAESQPCDTQQAHVSEAMEVLRQGPRSEELFEDDQPDGVRDECVRLLLELGAPYTNSACESRIIREGLALARVPQLINEAIVDMAVARGQQKPRDTASA